MIKIENTEVVGWEHAIRGMRNPMNSWNKSDSLFDYMIDDDRPEDFIGKKDLTLMKNLRNAGTDHRKFMRMITVYLDITAPLYWWKEFDTYKVGTVANSCSTMHKIGEKRFELSDFSVDHMIPVIRETFENTIIRALNEIRDCYIGFDGFKHKLGDLSKKDYWWQMIQLLPSSYNQKRTIMFNYEVLANIYTSRKNHKLDEWVEFCKWIETLPYSEIITGGEKCIT